MVNTFFCACLSLLELPTVPWWIWSVWNYSPPSSRRGLSIPGHCCETVCGSLEQKLSEALWVITSSQFSASAWGTAHPMVLQPGAWKEKNMWCKPASDLKPRHKLEQSSQPTAFSNASEQQMSCEPLRIRGCLLLYRADLYTKPGLLGKDAEMKRQYSLTFGGEKNNSIREFLLLILIVFDYKQLLRMLEIVQWWHQKHWVEFLNDHFRKSGIVFLLLR